MAKVNCEDCVHFRSAPFEARVAGCYLPANMPQRQSDAYLDEQQIPGDHEKINIRGNCPDFQARKAKPKLLDWLLKLGA